MVYLQFPPKFLVVSAPAAALLAVLDLAAVPTRRRRATAIALVAAGSVLGVAILRADAAFAGLGRQAAALLIAPRVAAGEKVWYTGHWGFQHYADEAGGRIVTAGGPLPAPGDFVVSALRADFERTIRLVPGREPVATLSDARPGGRILSRRAMAGFYTNWIGPLPWSWGDDEVERFDLWRIAPTPGGAAR